MEVRQKQKKKKKVIEFLILEGETPAKLISTKDFKMYTKMKIWFSTLQMGRPQKKTSNEEWGAARNLRRQPRAY